MGLTPMASSPNRSVTGRSPQRNWRAARLSTIVEFNGGSHWDNRNKIMTTDRKGLFAGCALVAATLIGTLSARAAEPLPVIELYTSQGCSSCPPADRLFESYSKRTDVIALSFAVDYWDYLGWKDTLASPRFTERQRDYARHRGEGQVYTPQAVIDGRAHAVGSDRSAIEAALAKRPGGAATNGLRIAVSSDKRRLALETSGPGPRTPCTVWIATVSPTVTVKVERGENRGRQITYTNVVRKIEAVAAWDGKPAQLPIALDEPAGTGLRHVALIQDGKGGPLVAGAWLD